MLAMNGWELRTKEGKEVSSGDTVTDFRGETAILEGGRPPHKPSSEGFVTTSKSPWCYAGVYGLKWVKLS